MADIDWSVAPSMTAGPSREQEAQRLRELNRTRGALLGALTPLPVEQATNLPGAGGLIGGLALMAAPQSRVFAPIMRLAEKTPAMVRPYVPSLFGSAIGTTAGTLGEQAILGKDFFSTETGQKLLENNIENAVFDVGGNLAFTAFGKTYKIGKDVADKLIGKTGAFTTPDQMARKAAQEWLSSQGATLTKGQLTGNIGTQAVEGTLKYTTGAPAFAKQQEGVKQAIESGTKQVMDTLDTSDAFKTALKQGDPTQMAVGDRFQNALKTAEEAMKEKYRPVYQRMEQEGDGLRVDLSGYKTTAESELVKIQRRYPSGKYPEAVQQKVDVLSEIIGLPNEVSFTAAHDIRSDLLSSARGLKQEGKATTAKEMLYNKAAQDLKNRMDYVAVITFGNQEVKDQARALGIKGGIDSPAGLRTGQVILSPIENLDDIKAYENYIKGLPRSPELVSRGENDLLRDYWNAQKGYGDAMKGFYNGTVSSALKAEPSAVGEYLFNTDRPERMRAAYKAISEMQKYLPAEKGKGLVDELRYGYLSKMLSSPEEVAGFAKKLENENFKQSFDYLFNDPKQKKFITDLTNAAKYGLEEESGSTALRTKLIGATAATATGVGSYLALPENTANQLAGAVGSAGLLYLTPKLIAKSLTNKEAMDALAMLSKAQTNPKYAGAVGGKIADMLNKSGIIDNEYLTEVNTMIHGKQPQEQQTQPQQIDWSVAPKPSE